MKIMLCLVFICEHMEPAFIFNPPPLVSFKLSKGTKLFEVSENFSYMYTDICDTNSIAGGTCINIGNDAFGPVRLYVILNIKTLTKTLLTMPVR